MDENTVLLVFAIEKLNAEHRLLDPRLRSILEELPRSEFAKVADGLEKDRDLDRLIAQFRPGFLNDAMCDVAQKLGKRIQF